MRLSLAVLSLLAASAPLPASAAGCFGALERVRVEIKDAFKEDLSCEALEAAAKALPVRLQPGEPGWAFAGELDLREQLAVRYEISVPTGGLPIGYVERQTPEGGALVAVFGFELPRRSWALLAAAQSEELPERGALAQAIGEGAAYDRAGFYRREAGGRFENAGRWLKLEQGGVWTKAHPAPTGEARVCGPCGGWLCPETSLACFADFNGNSVEEILLTDDCRPQVCGLRLLEPAAEGRMAVLLNEPGVSGQWVLRPEGWALVSEPFCSEGELCGRGERSLGNPTCDRPEVYRFDKASGLPVADAALREAYFPVEERPAPADCDLEGAKSVLVLAPGRRFVRYVKP